MISNLLLKGGALRYLFKLCLMLSKVLARYLFPFRSQAPNQNPSSAWSNILMSNCSKSNRPSPPSASNRYTLKILPAFSLARFIFLGTVSSFFFSIFAFVKTENRLLFYLPPLQNTAASLNYNFRLQRNARSKQQSLTHIKTFALHTPALKFVRGHNICAV